MTPLINHRLAGVEVEAAVAVEGPAEVVVAEAAVPAQVAAVVEPARVVVAVVAPVLGSEPGSEPASVPVLVVGRPPAQTQSPR